MSKDSKQKHKDSKTHHRTKPQTSALRRDASPKVRPSRQRQSTVSDKKTAAFLAAAAKFEGTLKHDYTELRKSRLKLEEIVQLLDSGADPASIMNCVESAVQQTRATLRASRIVRELEELKTKAKEALGYSGEPQTI